MHHRRYKGHAGINKLIYAMRSTELLHDIVNEFGGDNKPGLNNALRAYRTQVKHEVLSKVTNATKLIKALYR